VTVYWLMFAPLAILALAERKQSDMSLRPFFGMSGIAATIILILLIGFRYRVGGDWDNYFWKFRSLRYMTLDDLIRMRIDPGYGLLNRLAGSMDWGIIGVNLMSAVLFSIGLMLFCRQQPRPWLALLVAVPYLIIVVGMGYTRQAVAIGLAMIGLAALAQNSTGKFVWWIILAGLFHKSAIVLLPIAILATTEKKIWTATWVTVTSAVTYWAVLHDSLDNLVTTYVQTEMNSQGAIIRVAMNTLPAVVFLALRSKFELLPTERKLWTWMSLAAVGAIPLLIVLPSSTAVDRMALYLIPLQLFVLSRLPDAIGRMKHKRSAVAFGVVSYSAAIQFVWLNYASHANSWIPYRFYPLETL
jgi:EpsG-like putative glucosyltransferase